MCASTIVSIFSFLSLSLIDLYSRCGGLVSCEGSQLNLSVGFFFNAYTKSSYLLLGFFLKTFLWSMKYLGVKSGDTLIDNGFTGCNMLHNSCPSSVNLNH